MTIRTHSIDNSLNAITGRVETIETSLSLVAGIKAVRGDVNCEIAIYDKTGFQYNIVMEQHRFGIWSTRAGKFIWVATF